MINWSRWKKQVRIREEADGGFSSKLALFRPRRLEPPRRKQNDSNKLKRDQLSQWHSVAGVAWKGFIGLCQVERNNGSDLRKVLDLNRLLFWLAYDKPALLLRQGDSIFKRTKDRFFDTTWKLWFLGVEWNVLASLTAKLVNLVGILLWKPPN